MSDELCPTLRAHGIRQTQAGYSIQDGEIIDFDKKVCRICTECTEPVCYYFMPTGQKRVMSRGTV